ncbi:MAG: NTP transferase domain-containing protein [Rhodoglobus sp.]
MGGDSTHTTGIVLAAGAGTRAGGPKALLRMPDGTPWLELACAFLSDSGCDRVVAVLGAGERIARPLVPATAEVLVAVDWEVGMSASLRAGLARASGDAVLITLVDLPGPPTAVGLRVMSGSGALRQATYGGAPGHPVFIGAEHWDAAAASLTGDRGARHYLVEHAVNEIECGDLWNGLDRDDG